MKEHLSDYWVAPKEEWDSFKAFLNGNAQFRTILEDYVQVHPTKERQEIMNAYLESINFSRRKLDDAFGDYLEGRR